MIALVIVLITRRKEIVMVENVNKIGNVHIT